jgi:hypothetical protein
MYPHPALPYKKPYSGEYSYAIEPKSDYMQREGGSKAGSATQTGLGR